MESGKTMLDQQLDISEDALSMVAEEYQESIRALKQCINVLRQWHGPEAFEIYYDHSPEMALVREVLPEYRVPQDG